jgi:hypothetical protein
MTDISFRFRLSGSESLIALINSSLILFKVFNAIGIEHSQLNHVSFVVIALEFVPRNDTGSLTLTAVVHVSLKARAVTSTTVGGVLDKPALKG